MSEVVLDPKHGDLLLDLATGTGWTARGCAVKGAKLTGIDSTFGVTFVESAMHQ